MVQAAGNSLNSEINPRLEKGYVQVYTGNGKGKTTAAIGLAIRAIGAGLKVYIAQFMKNGNSSEFKCIQQLTNDIKIDSFLVAERNRVRNRNNVRSLDGLPKSTGWQTRLKNIFLSQEFDIVILEEANMAIMCGLMSVKDILSIIAGKPLTVELVITGRYAHPDIIKRADLVTEMKEVKHYYQDGVNARMGIEQ